MTYTPFPVWPAPEGGEGGGVTSHDASEVTSGTLDIARIPTGTTSTTVPLGNDSRFADARTPTAHKTSHATGGSDALTASDIGALPDDTIIPDVSGLQTALDGKLATSDVRVPPTPVGQADGKQLVVASDALVYATPAGAVWEVVHDTTLGSDQSTVSFADLSAFDEIEVRWVARASGTSNERSNLWIQFNSDTGFNYGYTQVGRIQNSPHTTQVTGNPSGSLGLIPASITNTNRMGTGKASFWPGPAGSHKTVDATSGMPASNSVNINIIHCVTAWANTSAAISSMLLFAEYGNLVAGSRFTVLGRR